MGSLAGSQIELRKYAGETGGIGEKELETVSSGAEQKAGAESLTPVEKESDSLLKSQEALAGSGSAVKNAVTDGFNAIGNLVSGICNGLVSWSWL